MKARVLVVVLGISLAAVAALAHGGEEHVMGTVTKVTANSITVKTTAKDPVTVGVVPATKFTKGKVAEKITDLNVGDRVVIHATEPTEGTLVADTVEFSTPKPASATAGHAAAAAKTTNGASSRQH
jgi:ribosomal protein S1